MKKPTEDFCLCVSCGLFAFQTKKQMNIMLTICYLKNWNIKKEKKQKKGKKELKGKGGTGRDE